MLRRTIVLVALLLAAMTPLPALADTPVADLSAERTCLEGGGVEVRFTVTNVSDHRIRISPDFHVELVGHGPGERGYGVLFVFPAPGWDRIPAGESRTFVLHFGVGFEGEPSVEIDSIRLSLVSEVFFARDPSVFERIGLPGCQIPGPR